MLICMQYDDSNRSHRPPNRTYDVSSQRDWIQQQNTKHIDNTDSADTNRLQSLYKYLVDNDCTQSTGHPHITLQHHDVSGIGFYASQSIPTDTILLKLQSGLHIKPIDDKTHVLYNVSPFTSLVLHLLHIQHNTQSTQHSYVTTLPTQYHNILNLTRKQLKQIQGCGILNAVEYSDTELIYQSQIESYCKQHTDTFGESVTLQQYNYMVSTVMSRAFDISKHSETVYENSQPVIVPLADMLNTSVHLNNVNCYVEWTDSGEFILKSKCGIAANTELLIDYSSTQMSNSDTLRRYGFVDPTNTHTTVDIGVESVIDLCTMNAGEDDPDSDQLANDIIDAVEHPFIYLHKIETTGSVELGIIIACCMQLLPLNVLQQTHQQQYISFITLPLTQQLQIFELYLLTLYQRQSEYPSTLHKDENLLQQTSTDQWRVQYYKQNVLSDDIVQTDLYRYKAALQLRVEEQRLLQQHIEYMRAKIAHIAETSSSKRAKT